MYFYNHCGLYESYIVNGVLIVIFALFGVAMNCRMVTEGSNRMQQDTTFAQRWYEETENSGFGAA